MEESITNDEFEIIEEEVEFDEELYNKNVVENDFNDSDDFDGIGSDEAIFTEEDGDTNA